MRGDKVFATPTWGDEKNFHVPLAKNITWEMIVEPDSKYSSAYTPLPYLIGNVVYRIVPSLYALRILNWLVVFFTTSADFELAWAWRYSQDFKDTYKIAIEKAKFERENIPEILTLCDKYEIPITWVTVGHLFIKECNRNNGIAH